MLAATIIASANVSKSGRGVASHRKDGLSIAQKLGVITTSEKGVVNKNLDKKITLNVGGRRHETWASTLEMIPGTRLALLAHLLEADESYDFDTDEYFFDRHPTAFESIIQYYRTEELHVNHNLCGNTMKHELTFWGVEEQEIEPCCWAEYSRFTEHKDTLKDLDENFFQAEEEEYNAVPSSGWKNFVARTWSLLEEPGSSRGAKVYAVLSMSFVAVSIAIFVLETHKLFQVDSVSGISMSTLLPEDATTPTDKDCCCDTTERANATAKYTPVTHPSLRIVDYVCVAFFALEFLMRFSFCPNKLRFWRSALNVIDLVCLIPHFTSIAMAELQPENEASDLVKTILMLRIIRILRIFKLMKHYSAFKILVYTIKVSTRELLLMIVFLMSGVLMFASIIHFAEKENFPNIPIGIWWALVTMTTVGYGDKYPVGYIGFGVGSVCVICGVLVIAFTVPIVVNNFSLYYSHAQTRIKIPKRGTKKGAGDKPPSKFKSISEISASSNSTGFNSIPPFSPREEKAKLVKRPNPNNLNGDKEQKIYNIPMSKGKQDKLVSHGKESARSGNTPVETSHVRVDDIASIDSGIADANSQKKQYEEQTQRIMDDLVNNDQKFADERKRQEWLIKQKREQRARAAQQGTDQPPKPIDGKEEDNVKFKEGKKKKKK